MKHVAGTPPHTPLFGLPVALALLGGVVACLWLPWLAPWWLSLVLLLAGMVGWANWPAFPLRMPSHAACFRAGKRRLMIISNS